MYPFDTQDVSVNLTIMLVMTTIFPSKIEALPPTSDTKMIDAWLIFSLLIPFAAVVIQTAIECYRRDDADDENISNITGVEIDVQTTIFV